MQYWIVKSGTKEVISGPFETQDEANKEMARFPVGGDAKAVTQGNYLGNGLIEAVQSGMTFKIDWDGESIVHVEYVRGGKVGLIRLNRPKTASGQPIRPEDKIEMNIEEFEASAKPVNYNPRTKKFESIYDLEKAKEELQYALQDLRDAKAAGEDKEVIKELQDEVKHCREVLDSLSESASSQKEANKLLNVWFNDHSPSAWGSKSFVVSKLAKSMGVSLKMAAELHKNWANLNESASYEKDMDENKPVVIKGVKGMKSTPFTKKFKNMAAYEKWADSEAAENFEVYEVMNESASFDFSTTNNADILKVSAALEKAGIPFEVEEKGESFVVKVLDSRDQLVASELIGDTMKEGLDGNPGDKGHYLDWCVVRNKKPESPESLRVYANLFGISITTENQLRKALNLKESSGFSEGEEVKVVGNVSGEGKIGIIRDMAPSGHFYVVKFNDGTSSSYHESNLIAYEGDDEDEDLDESEDYSNVVSQHEHRNKSATVFKKDDGFEVIFYRDGGKLSRDFYDSKEEAQSEAKAWVAGGVNESESRKIGIEHYSDGTRVISTYWDGRSLAKFIHPEQYNEVEEGGWAYSDGNEPNNAVNSIEDFIGLSLHLIQQGGGELYINGKQAHAKNIDQTSGSPVSIGELQFESAQLSPFERVGLNPVYSEDGKKATIKIFSECEMDKFNKVVEAYLNTYIESIEYKIEESDDNCLYVIEVKLVQSPETKGDPETMMKELKTESVLVENEVTDQVLASIAAFLKSNPNLVVSGSYNSTKTYNKNGVEFGYSYSSQTRPPLVTVSLLNDKLSLLGLLTEPPKFIMRANFNGLHSVSSLKSTILNKAKSSLIQQLKNEKEKSTEQIDQLLKLMQ